ncbi:MAG: zinc-dependent metalloprotease [Flavobacteriales bacterium]|nr:zinc-dependent metalloprotease [Flavobacteriales bacterium]
MHRSLLSKITLVAAVVISMTVNAQHRCGFDYYVQHQKENNPVYYEAYRQVMENWQRDHHNRGGGGGVYVLPVVFHVVYHEENQNLPDSVIWSQIEVLNEDYRRLNADAINTRSEFLPVAADCEIEFQLAQVDPNGNPTSGITHTYTEETGFSLDLFSTTNTLDAVKHSDEGGVDAWDPEHYINIWVCNIEASLFGQIFGLSYPPAGLDNWPAGSSAPSPGDEGVIVHYTTVGRNNPYAGDDGFDDNDGGRTCTHELGHYLGLRHTWGDELFFDVCSEDDGMTDTPLCGSGDQYTCNYEANTCDEGDTDLPDQLENYMDYTRDECYNMFTEDQKSLMRYVLEELRPGLLEGVGIAETDAHQAFTVSPNPASSFVTVQLADHSTASSIKLFDTTGRIVLQQPINGATTILLDIDQLLPGTYFIQLDEHEGSELLIKQ